MQTFLLSHIFPYNSITCGWNLISKNDVVLNFKYLFFYIKLIHFGLFFRPQNMNQGWYALATSSQGNFQDRTEFYTPKISQTGPQCTLKFFYYMDGPSVDSLMVSYTVEGRQTSLWQASGGSNQVWQPAEVLIGPMYNIVVKIQSRRGRNYQGAIAIDDLQFIDCAPPIAQQTCQSNQFTCNNKYCIDPKLQCNFANDCGDKSDEDVSVFIHPFLKYRVNLILISNISNVHFCT